MGQFSPSQISPAKCRRAEYTVIGDAVNLGARICGITPGGEVWIGPETYRQAKDYLEVQEL